MDKIKITLFVFLMAFTITSHGQTINSKIVENGGLGEYKAIAVNDENFPGYTIYRPENLEEAVIKKGKLPILLHANGGCFNSPLMEEKGLSNIASHGYIVIAIGPFSEMSPPDKLEDIVAPGGNRPPAEENSSTFSPTHSRQLLEALDLIAIENSNQESEYYNKIDLEKVAAEGASCGGLQAISISYDPRIKTLIMQNSGILNNGSGLNMAESPNGTTFQKNDLPELNIPLIYVVGNETDVAFPNAKSDFEEINHVPVVFCSNSAVGHEGTSLQPAGGSFTTVKLAWLDWQLKDKVWKSALFFDEDYAKNLFPEWSIMSKNF